MAMCASFWSCRLRRLGKQKIVIGLADPWVCRGVPELCLITTEGTMVLERTRGKGTKAPKIRGLCLFGFLILRDELWVRLLRRASTLQSASFSSGSKLYRNPSELNGRYFGLQSNMRFFRRGENTSGIMIYLNILLNLLFNTQHLRQNPVEHIGHAKRGQHKNVLKGQRAYKLSIKKHCNRQYNKKWKTTRSTKVICGIKTTSFAAHCLEPLWLFISILFLHLAQQNWKHLAHPKHKCHLHRGNVIFLKTERCILRTPPLQRYLC